LLERDSELSELASDVAAARVGTGWLVLVEGPAGIGKTGLLAAAASLAEEAGLVVARARGGELEAGFAFGIVRQLFEPLLRDRPRQRARLSRGAAGLAMEVLGPSVGGSPRAAVRLPEAVHGLYWLALNLAERGPLLVLVDDAHWADPSSLRFLSYLAGRLEGVGVLVVVAARRIEAPAADDLLAVVMRERVTKVVELQPLSVAATASLLAHEYQDEVAPEFARACHEATRGNPFYLRELIRALRADGIDPSAAQVSRVAGQGPASVARSVLTRIAGLSPAAVSVARALAVLGGEARLRDLTEVGSLDEAFVIEAVDRLTDAEIVVGTDPVVFAHPIVRASIHADIRPGERARARLHAARVLASSGATAERVAGHLLAARPARDRWVVDTLTEAAGDALSQGAPDTAVAYLKRALAEAPERDLRQKVLAFARPVRISRLPTRRQRPSGVCPASGESRPLRRRRPVSTRVNGLEAAASSVSLGVRARGVARCPRRGRKRALAPGGSADEPRKPPRRLSTNSSSHKPTVSARALLNWGARRVAYFTLYPRDAFLIWPVLASWVNRVETLPGLRFRALAISPAVLSGCLARNSMMRTLMSL